MDTLIMSRTWRYGRHFCVWIMAARMWSWSPATIRHDPSLVVWLTAWPRPPLNDPVLASFVMLPKFFLILLLTVFPMDPNCLTTELSCLAVLDLLAAVPWLDTLVTSQSRSEAESTESGEVSSRSRKQAGSGTWTTSRYSFSSTSFSDWVRSRVPRMLGLFSSRPHSIWRPGSRANWTGRMLCSLSVRGITAEKRSCHDQCLRIFRPTWKCWHRLHGHQGGEVAGVVSEDEGGLVALCPGHLQRQVDAAKWDRGEGLAIGVLEIVHFISEVIPLNHLCPLTHFEDSVRDHDDGPPEDVGENEDVDFLQRLVQRVCVPGVILGHGGQPRPPLGCRGRVVVDVCPRVWRG